MGNNGLCVAKDMRLTFDVVFKTAAAGDPDMTNDYNGLVNKSKYTLELVIL